MWQKKTVLLLLLLLLLLLCKLLLLLCNCGGCRGGYICGKGKRQFYGCCCFFCCLQLPVWLPLAASVPFATIDSDAMGIVLNC